MLSYESELMNSIPPSQDPSKSSFLVDFSLSKLESKLSLQKNSSTLNLADSFIGDQGCSLLSNYIKENLNLQSLDLRGNSISSEGIRLLSSAFRQQHFIRHISLEWNNIGDSIQFLLESLAYNTSVQSLDLRNNRIGPEGALAIARFFDTNTSIIKIDLRWNEIGAAGAERILQVLPKCLSLKAIEVSGNKIPEEMLVEFDNEMGSRGALNESKMSFKRIEDFARNEEVDTSLRKSPVRANYSYNDELYIKFEAQMINNARNEAKINELEILLQQETRKTQDLRNDLYRELESEKARRAYSDQTLMILKEESLKRDMDNQRLIQDLENKLSSTENDYKGLLLEYEDLQNQFENAISESQAQLRNLEQKLSSQERQAQQSEENFRNKIERLKKEHEQIQSSQARDFEAKLENVIEIQNSLDTEKEALESETRILKNQISQIKHQSQCNLKDLESRLLEEASEKLSFTERNYEVRLQNLEDTKEIYNKRLQDLQKDLISSEKKSTDQINSLENTISLLREEKSDLTLRLQKISGQKDLIHNDLQATRASLDRLQAENTDLNRVLKEKKEAHSVQIEKLSQDYNAEKKYLESTKDSLIEQIRKLDNELNKVKRDRDRVLKEHEFLSDSLKQKVNLMIQETVLGHMRKVGGDN